MHMPRRAKFAVAFFSFLFAVVHAQSPAISRPSPAVPVPTATRDLVTRDLGQAPASTPLRRMHLVLSRTPQQEQELKQLLDRQQDKSSPEYHQWLTPSSFGAAFGPSDRDLATLSSWLANQGFDSIHVNTGRTLLEFSGSVASVQGVFHTAIHRVSVAGQTAYTTVTPPKIPAALAPFVAAVAPLNGVPSSPAKPALTINSNGTTYYAITPYDFATLYNITPLWTASTPIDGTGETIAVVGESDINPADFIAFRNLFAFPLGNTNTSTGTQYLNIIYNGNNPGIQSSEFHADSDTQWAAAAAKGATIDYVASQSTEASSGNDLSAAYIVDNNLAPILVDSYYTCELQLGTAGNAFYKNLWQQAAAQGITVVAPSGDSGAAACDAFHVAPASGGKAVNGVASTPYNVAVGGTEFYAPNGVGDYFNPTNSATQASVKSYIPEVPWNDSCTNPAIYQLAPYTGLTAEQTCNNSSAQAAGLVTTAGAGGGASSCTSSDGETTASCTSGYPKPSWQSSPGVPSDGVRDLPDVALFASQGRTNSFYIVCQQDRNTDGQPCNLAAPYADFAAYGGTEIATPAFAGILALAAQKAGTRIGNPNYVLYTLATRQSAAGTACDSTGTTSAGCIFHDITLGTNTMPCVTGSLNCTTLNAGDSIGILSAPSASVGYDLASGLGSVDAYNLVSSYTTVTFTPSTAILSLTPSTVVHGSPVTTTTTVSGPNGTPTGEVAINAQAASGSVGAGPLVNGVFTEAFTTFPGGTYGVQAHYAGDSSNAAADSNFVSLTVTPEPSTTSIQTLSYNPSNGSSTLVTAAPYGNIYYIRVDVKGQSGQGTPTGNVSIDDDGTIFGSGNIRLNSSGYAEGQNNALSPGTHVFTAAYQGDPSFDPSTAPSATLVISKAPTTTSVSSSATTVSVGDIITLSAVVSTQSYGYSSPSGNILFYSGSTLLGTASLVAGQNATTSYDQGTATLTLSAQNFPIGNGTLIATYVGDTNYLPSSSPSSPLQVTGSNLTPSSTYVFPTPYSVGQNGTILFTSITMPALPTPTGTVQFVVDGNNTGVPQTVVATSTPGGYAGLQTSTSGFAVGLHTLTATYSGDATYRSSNSTASSFLITSPGTASIINFTANPTNLVQGTFVSVPTSISSTSTGLPAATGTVQLVLDGSLYGASFALTDGSVTLPLATSTLQVGTHLLDVFYSGDTVYSSAYGTPINIVIRAPGITPSSVAIVGLAQFVALGSNAAVSGVVSPAGNPTPTGILQVTIDNGNPGTPILLTGATTPVTLPTADLPLGPHTARLFYSGDNTYNSATSPNYPFTIVVPNFTISPATLDVSVSHLQSFNSETFTITPTGGFTGPVALSCSGLPANTSCGFTPATVTLNGSSAMTSILNFNLNTGLFTRNQPTRLSNAELTELACLLCLGLPLTFAKKRRFSRLLGILFVLVAAQALNGCGGGGSLYGPGTTPLGTYKVIITGTGATISNSATVTLAVTE